MEGPLRIPAQAPLAAAGTTARHGFEPYANNGGYDSRGRLQQHRRLFHYLRRTHSPLLSQLDASTIVAIAGDDFCVVAADTRQSSGYSINTRYAPKAFAQYVANLT